MGMTDNRNLVELTAEEKRDLERWAQSRTLPAGDVFRARLILALAAGKSYREIESGMQTSAATIARWRERFERDGLAGLEGRHRGSRPRTATAAVQARVVRRVQQKPNDGSTHWSCRKLAQELGLSKSTVQRILTQVHPDLFLLAKPSGVVVREDPTRRHRPGRFHLGCRSRPQTAEIHSSLRDIGETVSLDLYRSTETHS